MYFVSSKYSRSIMHIKGLLAFCLTGMCGGLAHAVTMMRGRGMLYTNEEVSTGQHLTRRSTVPGLLFLGIADVLLYLLFVSFLSLSAWTNSIDDEYFSNSVGMFFRLIEGGYGQLLMLVFAVLNVVVGVHRYIVFRRTDSVAAKFLGSSMLAASGMIVCLFVSYGMVTYYVR